jgi:hypothetical protein
MKIMAEHDVSDDPKYCTCGDSGGWYTLCGYMKRKDKTGKRGEPILRNIPRCALFGEWLNGHGVFVEKCDKCVNAKRSET